MPQARGMGTGDVCASEWAKGDPVSADIVSTRGCHTHGREITSPNPISDAKGSIQLTMTGKGKSCPKEPDQGEQPVLGTSA